MECSSELLTFLVDYFFFFAVMMLCVTLAHEGHEILKTHVAESYA